MKKIFAILLVFIMVLSGCQSDLPSGNNFSGFEGYTQELSEEELKNAMKNGKVATYGNVTVKLSNNVAKTNGGATDNIMIRSKRAIAFVNPLTHTEAYRPEKTFADAVKGYVLFDGKVVRPKEIININVKYA